MKKFSLYFLVIFFILLVSVPGYWLLRGKPAAEVSIIEGRVLGLPEKSYPTLKIALDYIQQGEPEKAISLVWDLYTGGSLQKKFDGAVTDQFPFRMPLIIFAKAVDRQIINLSYRFSDDDVIPADMTSEIYIMLKHDALIVPPGSFDQNIRNNIDHRLANYKDIASRYPDLNIYIYYLETLPYSQYHPLNAYFSNADQGQGFEYFQSNLPEKINLDFMPLDNVEGHLKNYYRTDHHWNVNGILGAYKGIYDLISNDKTDFPRKLSSTTLIPFPDIEFLGSYARKTLYPLKGDDFIGYEAEFPICVIKDQGVPGDYDFRDEYAAGNYPTTAYTDHYGTYFGSQKGLLEYICETQTDRNILIIGDSYTRPLVALIASHYHHTFFVDLRQNIDFTMSDFTQNHTIDDFLIVSDYEVVFMDTDQWMIQP